jgi:hypothetical protein
MRTRNQNRIAACVPVLALLLACGDDDDSRSRLPEGYGDYRDENVTAIGGGSDEAEPDDEDVPPPPGTSDDVPVGDVQVATPDNDGEVCFDDGLCEVPPTDESNWCEREGGPVDLVYVDGELVETICYPPAEDPERPVETIDGVREGDVEVVQMANNTTVLFSDDTDGVPFEGDINVDGNNVAIYGNGADNTIVDGSIELDGNNVRLRGVTITGDLVIRKNNVAVVLCRILGNVVLETESTNGSVFAENDIFGSFTSDSNGNVFVGNDVLGAWTITGNGNTCDRNFAFSDGDGDDLVSDDERTGVELECP